MYSNNRFSSLLKKLMCSAFLSLSLIGSSQEIINTYEVADMGYLRSPMESNNGIVLSNNRFSEIYVLRDNQLTTLVTGRGCGIYTQMSKDKSLVGFKSINDQDLQAPAILDVATGQVTLLEDYCHQCGQVSFSDDGTMAYTMGNTLVIRKGDSRKTFDLGFYTNIANISPDGSQVAYSNIDGRMFIINLSTGNIELVGVQDGYNGVWSPDGSKLAIHTAIGTLAVLDRSNNQVHNLGYGQSASWANNSTELIYTATDGIDEMRITGNSIQKVNFDGSNRMTLVASTDNMPTDAIVTSDNRLLVPYATGEKRGLAMRMVPSSGISTLSVSAAETSLFAIEDDAVFGARLGDICEDPNFRPATLKPTDGITTKAFQQKIGALDIPYLSQIYDSPSINGCTSYGYVTCAPTSACMYLGYYGLLNKKATTSRYDSSTKYYAYAIGQQYTNQAGTYTFNTGAYKSCATIYGGYGYMWATSSPQSTIIEFMRLNGCPGGVKTYSSSTAWSTFQTEAAAGRPYIICAAWASSGHVVCGFATNCKYRTATGFTEQTGSFVCHDPYGDYNDSSWADGDGQHSTYDWVGYNNGQGNIGTYYWSTSYTPPAEPVEVKLTCTPASIELSGEVGSSDNIYVDVVVKGENLSTAIAVASATGAITPTKLSGWNDLTGGTLRLTLNTNFSKGAGTYESYVAVQSTSSYRVEIQTKVTLTDPAGSTDPGTTEPEPTPDVQAGLTKLWQNTTSVPGSASGGDFRFAGVSNDHLLVVDKTNLKIYELTETGYTEYYNCADALNTHWSATSMGPAIACDDAGNILVHTGWSGATSGSNFMIISADLSKTYKLDLSAVDGYTAARVDQIGRIRGNMLSSEGGYAFITPSGASTVLIVKIVNGAIDSNYTQVSNATGLTFDTSSLAQPAFETVAEINALMDDNADLSNSFVMRKRGNPTNVFTWNADNSALTTTYTFSATTSEGYTTTNASSEGFDWFTLEGKSYFIMPLSTDGTTAGRCTAWAIYDQDANLVASATENVKTGIGQGMGSFIAVPNNDKSVYIYHFVAGNVAEKYIYATEPTSGVEDILIEENADAPVEYYNLQGIKVANPENGIYIKVQGNKVSKVYVK